MFRLYRNAERISRIGVKIFSYADSLTTTRRLEYAKLEYGKAAECRDYSFSAPRRFMIADRYRRLCFGYSDCQLFSFYYVYCLQRIVHLFRKFQLLGQGLACNVVVKTLRGFAKQVAFLYFDDYIVRNIKTLFLSDVLNSVDKFP